MIPTSFDYCSNYRPGFQCTKDKVHSILKKGPSQVGIDAAGIQHYRGGILYTASCVNDNHAVVMVGYGVENGNDYWVIRNSWGPTWGEAGHVRIDSRSGKYACIVQNESVRPDFS